ncbi:PD-(D/E)XK nuclease family protein [Ornithinimicrobium sp. F0845]|uniref:RecB family exonuclease n=1 Tax=Ornithinimicrobium sp. F0845 TaxID=2926412 RepID=UPI001FF1BEB8|nr:PD-(D/E)XK nuclease family protein [Ornithinimicrobium sp. F0845]MCK0113259.1 PD-(D/E)XK nuclease family protein [Ornithinimicrobium sp. F0845]
MSPALSPSRASDFMQCPLLYRFRVIDRLPEPPSAAAARGTLVHAALERVFDLPAPQRTPEATIALLPGEWARLVEEEPELASLLAAPGEEVTPLDDTAPQVTEADRERAWFEEAAGFVRTWFTLEDPTRLEPAERELYVEAEVDGLVMRGYVDRLDVAPDGRLRVVDYKTGRSPSEQWEGKALFQMKFYALVLWRTRGVVPTLLQLVYLRDGQVLRYAPEERELLATERKVKALWAAIEVAATTGDWRPRTGRLCSWCHHKPICPAFGGTPPPLPEDAKSRALDPRATGQTAPADDADE